MQPGETVLRYKIQARFSETLNTNVFIAVDTELNRRVILSVFPHPPAAELVQGIMTVKQANVIPVLFIEQADDTSFLVTEYPEGKSLQAEMQNPSLSFNDILDIGAQIADGLEAISQAGLVHGYVTPLNIFLKDGEAKLLFCLPGKKILNLSSSADQPPQPDLFYVSPEQTRGEKTDVRSDIFSLGSTLFHAATGRTAFEGSTVSVLLLEILTGDLPLPSSIKPDLPKEFDVIMQFALNNHRERRYGTAAEMAFALRRLKVAVTHKIDIRPEELESGLAPVAAPTQVPQKLESSRPQSASHTSVFVLLTLIIFIASALYILLPKWMDNHAILILPFSNEVRDPQAEYIGEGISDELIRSLSQMHSIQVISGDTAFYYKKAGLKPDEIGRMLNVGNILTGKVSRQNEYLRIYVELRNQHKGKEIWKYQQNIRPNEFPSFRKALQNRIAGTLHLELQPQEQEFAEGELNGNYSTYELYWKGRWHYRKHTQQDLLLSLEQYDQILKAEPESAPALAAIAESWFSLAHRHGVPDAFKEATQAALAAIKVNSRLSSAHAVLGATYLLSDLNFFQAEKELRRAVAISPNDSFAHSMLALLYLASERTEEAAQEMQTAQERNPLSPWMNLQFASFCVQLGQYDEAIGLTRRVADQDNTASVYLVMGDVYLAKAMPDKAMQAYKTAGALGSPQANLRNATAMAASGMKPEARTLLEKMANSNPIFPYGMARAYALLGENDQAFKWLEQAYDHRSPDLVLLKLDFAFDSIRSDPRFPQFLMRIGLWS